MMCTRKAMQGKNIVCISVCRYYQDWHTTTFKSAAQNCRVNLA